MQDWVVRSSANSLMRWTYFDIGYTEREAPMIARMRGVNLILRLSSTTGGGKDFDNTHFIRSLPYHTL